MDVVHRKGGTSCAIVGDVRRTRAVQCNSRDRPKDGCVCQCDFENQLRQNGCVEDGRVARSKEGVPVVDAKLRAITSGGVRLIVRPLSLIHI